MAAVDPVQYAIQMEHDGEAFYSEAAANTENPLGKKMFESLAADERRHGQIVRAIAEGMGAAMEGDMPKQRLVTLFSQLGSQLAAELGAEPDDSKVIEKAIDMEQASVQLYQEQAGKAQAEAHRALYQRLAQEESQHIEILRNTLAYLNDTGHWFLWDEQALLDGG